jgi:AcrR family transcriptional regulator
VSAAAPKPRIGRPGYDIETLLPIAAEVFTVRGYDGTSMDVLAAKLGISKSAIYHHVDSKDALLELALNRALDGLDAVADRIRLRDAPAIERLEQLVHDSVEVLIDRLPYVTLLLRARGNTVVERRALARRKQFDHFVASLVTEAIVAGDLRADADPTVTARLIFGLVNSLTEWYRPRKGDTGSTLATAICALAFQGLAAPN